MTTNRTSVNRRIKVSVALVTAGVVGSIVAAPFANAASHSTGASHHATAASTHHNRIVKMVRRHLAITDAADTYTSVAAPNRKHGDFGKLVVTNEADNAKVTFVKFHVTGVPAGDRVVDATLDFTRDNHHLPWSRLTLRRVSPNGWTQSNLVVSRAPQLGQKIASTFSARRLHDVSFPINNVIDHNGMYAFAVTSNAKHNVVRFQSQEARSAPELQLTYAHRIVTKVPPVVTPTPTPTVTPTTKPTTPVSTPTATPTTPVSTPTATPTTPVSTPTATSTTPVSTPTATPTTPVSTPTPTPTTPVSTPTPSSSPSESCSVSAKLVPSCGIIFGGVTTSWGGSDIVAQRNNAMSATSTQTVLSHDYRRPGQVLSPYDVTIAKTPGALLQLNWKPVNAWADADGTNATVNSQIDAMANSIKSLGSTKIFLTIYHEPENDVTSDPNCPNVTFKGSAGTPAQYRAMWANVEARFNALGVTNVVWDINYMNYSPWDCLVNEMWPGNDLVDWVFYESYSDNNSTFQTQTAHLYNFLTANSNAAHDYLSKPWGVGEFGSNATNTATRNAYYSGAKAAIDNNMFPKLKLLSLFDSPGIGGDFRVAFDSNSASDPTELANFMSFAQDPILAEGAASVNGQ